MGLFDKIADKVQGEGQQQEHNASNKYNEGKDKFNEGTKNFKEGASNFPENAASWTGDKVGL